MAAQPENAQVVATLNDTIAQLKKALEGAVKIHDYLIVSERAQAICQKACAAITGDKFVTVVGVNQPADGEAAAGSCGFPSEDDGVTCMLQNIPAGWGAPRVQAYVERFKLKPQQVQKGARDTRATITFANPSDRDEFVNAVESAKDKSTGGQSFRAITPKKVAPGVKRPAPTTPQAAAAGPGSGGPYVEGGGLGGGHQHKGKKAKKGGGGKREDVREAVCPLWNVPYGQQLNTKLEKVEQYLKEITKRAVQRHRSVREGFPMWLASAQDSSRRLCCPLEGILRSPQIEGYRNKSEFTIGLDQQEQPMVGFLLGSYTEGLTCVCDPSQCRHISPASLSCAKLLQTYIAHHSSLPAWDKRVHRGFWRLLVVREGRKETFLPVPVYRSSGGAEAMDTDADAGAAPAAGGGLLQGVAMEDLPVEQYLVKGAWAGEEAPGQLCSQVLEAEPAAPSPEEVLVILQIYPQATDEATIAKELAAAASCLQSGLKQEGRGQLANVFVQHHTGVANAAGPEAVTEPLGELLKRHGVEEPGLGQQLAIHDNLCEHKFRISPLAFFQVNSPACSLLYSAIGSWLRPTSETLLLDVCCGTGTIGISLARRVKAVIGVEVEATAVEDAKANSSLNGLDNCTWVEGKAEEVMHQLIQEHATKYQEVVAVVDPPRAGLHWSVLNALLTCPGLTRLVYVSCNPDSLMQNVTAFCQPWAVTAESAQKQRRNPNLGPAAGGGLPVYKPFRPVKSVALDLFPHTNHVETLMLLEREA